MEIYVIRHTPVNVSKNVCYGQSDLDTSKSFLQDAEELRKKLPSNFDQVFTSPLSRCTFLANELGFYDAILDERLKEMNFGDWELKKWEDINSDDLQNWMDNYDTVTTPNGESLMDLYLRVETFYEDLKNRNDRKVLIITHAGVIRCLWAKILEIPLKNCFKIPVGFDEVLIIDGEYDIIKKKC